MAKKEVLIINSDAAASSAFEAAKFGYVKDGATRVATLTSGDEEVSLFYGTANVGPISEGDVKKITTLSYAAGTAQESKATVVLDSAGNAEIKVINTTSGTMNLPVKTFESVGSGSASNAAAAIKALMDTEFAKSDSPFFGFSTTVSGAVIDIIAPIDSHFRLSGNDASTFAYTGSGTALAVPSVGTEAKVKELEKLGNTDKGVFGRAGSAATFKQPDSVVSGNYDLLLIEGTKSSNSKAVGNAKNYDHFEIWVAVKDGNSTVTPAAIVTQVEKLK
jgi:hypothetical protein|tara:strand:- start:2183 stop:3010 length:828 start_codon:yes stop_codon:yes gene_type:complete